MSLQTDRVAQMARLFVVCFVLGWLEGGDRNRFGCCRGVGANSQLEPGRRVSYRHIKVCNVTMERTEWESRFRCRVFTNNKKAIHRLDTCYETREALLASWLAEYLWPPGQGHSASQGYQRGWCLVPVGLH